MSERGKVNHLKAQFDREMAIAVTTPERTKYVHPITPVTSRAVNNYELDGDERLLVIEETVETKNVTEIEYDPDETTADEVLDDYLEGKDISSSVADRIYNAAAYNVLYTVVMFTLIMYILLTIIARLRANSVKKIRSSQVYVNPSLDSSVYATR